MVIVVGQLCKLVPAGTPVQLASGKPVHDLVADDVPGNCVAVVAPDVADCVVGGAVVATGAVVALGFVDVDGVVVGVREGWREVGLMLDVDGLLDEVDWSIGLGVGVA